MVAFHNAVRGTAVNNWWDNSSGRCTGPTYTVDSSGWFRADVAAQDGIALHGHAKVG